MRTVWSWSSLTLGRTFGSSTANRSRAANTPIRLHGCAGWSVSSLDAFFFFFFCRFVCAPAHVHSLEPASGQYYAPSSPYDTVHRSHLITKSTKWHVRPAKTQISLGIRPVWSESSLCAYWVAKDPNFLHADSEDWSDWADAHADLSLRWAHMLLCCFIMRRLIARIRCKMYSLTYSWGDIMSEKHTWNSLLLSKDSAVSGTWYQCHIQSFAFNFLVQVCFALSQKSLKSV